MPATNKLSPWLFSNLFEVAASTRLPVTTIREALALVGADYIDWFKTDSQGTDLRLFTSIPEETRRRILVAEFEPGIVDAYLGEDKLGQLLGHLDTPDWWIAALDIQGTPRFNHHTAARYFTAKQLARLPHVLKPGACWAGVAAMATLPRLNSKRELLLAWIFAHTQKHYGFAIEIAAKGGDSYSDPLFAQMLAESLRPLRTGVANHLLIRFCRRLKRLL